MNKTIKNRIRSEFGLMGPTHSLSAVAVFMLITALFPTFIFDKVLRTNNIIVYITSIGVVAGAALLCDGDNVKSTVISVLGIFGKLMSVIMRSSAVVVYNITKSRKDNSDPDPHRAFWHTGLSAILIFIMLKAVLLLDIPIKIFNKEMYISTIIAHIVVYVCLMLAFAGLFGKLYKKTKKQFMGGVVINVLSILITMLLLFLSPENITYHWIAGVVALGYFIHILGDTLTISGTPILFPLKKNGKRWWYHRLSKMKAGSSFEKVIIIPSCVFIIAFSAFRIFLLFKRV